MPEDPSLLAWLDAELVDLDRAALRRRLRERAGPQAAVVHVDGRELVNFSSNDYLGLAADERLAAAARRAIDEAGWGSGASPLVTGRSVQHAALEARLAAFEGTEAALVFPSGFAANAGTIPALAREGDVLLCDAKNHASLIDGCRLSKAERHIYPHAEVAAVEALLRAARSARRRWIVTDSLFSMDGDLAPLVELATLAQRFDALLAVDEAHATGVFGPHGRGAVEALLGQRPELHRRVAVRIGTLSKALGSAGGFVCGEQRLIDWLANRARSYVFSTAQPAATAAAATAALDIVEQEPQRRTRLLQQARELRERLAAEGWNTGRSAGPIIPLYVGDPAATMRLAEHLQRGGYLVPGIRPPTVPEGESLLRVTLTARHTAEMLEGLLGALATARRAALGV